MTIKTQPRIRIGTNPETHRPVNWNPRSGLGHLAVSNNTKIIEQISRLKLPEYKPDGSTRKAFNQMLKTIIEQCDQQWNINGWNTNRPTTPSYCVLRVNVDWLYDKTMRLLHETLMKTPILNQHLIIINYNPAATSIRKQLTIITHDTITQPGEET